MSQLVKMKRQANFKDFKRFGACKSLVEQKNLVFNSLVCKLGSLWHNLHANSLNKLLFLLTINHLGEQLVWITSTVDRRKILLC
jgi:hypothetical protein